MLRSQAQSDWHCSQRPDFSQLPVGSPGTEQEQAGHGGDTADGWRCLSDTLWRWNARDYLLDWVLEDQRKRKILGLWTVDCSHLLRLLRLVEG